MRVLFAATGDIALPAFHSLLGGKFHPIALITQPDKPAGRNKELRPPAIKRVAQAAGIPIFQPERIDDIAEALSELRADLMVVMAYGQILKERILHLPGTTIINLHASLLPKYRGAACIQAAIDAGDSQTGITAMHVVRALDAGDMIHHRSIPISPQDTGGTLHDKLAQLAATVLTETITLLEQGNAPRIPQNTEEATYVSKLDREHGKIDWFQPAHLIERRIRAYDPWPGTYTAAIENGTSSRLKIFPPTTIVSDANLSAGELRRHQNSLLVGCGDGCALRLADVQAEGAKRMPAADYLRGRNPQRFL